MNRIIISTIHHSHAASLGLSSPGALLRAQGIAADEPALHMHHHCKHLTKPKAIYHYTQTALRLDKHERPKSSFSSDMCNEEMMEISLSKQNFYCKESRWNSERGKVLKKKQLSFCTMIFNNCYTAIISNAWHCAIATLQLAWTLCTQHLLACATVSLAQRKRGKLAWHTYCCSVLL